MATSGEVVELEGRGRGPGGDRGPMGGPGSVLRLLVVDTVAAVAGLLALFGWRRCRPGRPPGPTLAVTATGLAAGGPEPMSGRLRHRWPPGGRRRRGAGR
jgi:hypothetical protein